MERLSSQPSEFSEPALMEPRGRTVVVPSGEVAFRSLCEALQSSDPALQAAAAHELRGYGGAAVDPLCTALTDPTEEVRVAAATSLGELGDPRAVGPLTSVLRQSLVGGTARRQLLAGLLLVFGILLVLIGYCWGTMVWRMGGGIVMLFNGGFQVALRMNRRRRARSQVCRAISGALLRIAEQHPTPQLREVLPELHALSADRIYQDRDARQATRHAAQRIAALTDELKSLPISSSPAAADAAVLPISAAEHRAAD